MSDQPVTIVSLNHPDGASVFQGELNHSDHPCKLLSCEQWLSTTAQNSQTALLFYFGKGMPATQDVDLVRERAAGQSWRAVFEGPCPTKLPKSLLLPPRYFLWPEDRAELVDWLDHPDDPGQRVREPCDLGLIGASELFQSTLATLRRFASCEAPLLILGETGSGKEQIARAAHRLSPRENGPFVMLHCGQFPAQVDDGHDSGPFTGASDGTLFLNDLEDLGPESQLDLLNFLQSQDHHAPGTTGPRIIAAARGDLTGPSAGFRADLYYRLSVLSLRLPPLRDRRGDAELLAQHFADHFAAQTGAPCKTLSHAFCKALRAYDWPGNVRELRNFMHRAWVLSRRAKICVAEVGAPGLACSSATDSAIRPYHEAREATLRAFEAVYLQKLMDATGGNVTQAAKLAGTERRSLGRMLKRHHMDAALH